MQASTNVPRRADTTAVHSLHRFVFSVPDLDKAADFYQAFGLDVRRTDGRVDLYTFGHPHRWGAATCASCGAILPEDRARAR